VLVVSAAGAWRSSEPRSVVGRSRQRRGGVLAVGGWWPRGIRRISRLILQLPRLAREPGVRVRARPSPQVAVIVAVNTD
jgi:hypothetical protein